jgi:hypothetical protein
MFHLCATLLVNSVNTLPRGSAPFPSSVYSSPILNWPVRFIPCDQGYAEFRADFAVELNSTGWTTDRIGCVMGGSELHKLCCKITIVECSLGTQSSRSSGDWVKRKFRIRMAPETAHVPVASLYRVYIRQLAQARVSSFPSTREALT